MTLQFNTFAKTTQILTYMNIFGSGVANSVKIYPSSVAMPALPPTTASAPAGFLINFTNFTTAKVGNQLKLTLPPSAVNAVATGVPNWFFYLNSNSGVIMGDGVGLSGSSPIITLSSMSLTSGTPYSLLDITLTIL